MKDELKIFADQYRESFDSYQVDADAMWGDIESRLETVEKASSRLLWSKLWKVAAILLVVCTVAYGYYLNSERVSIKKNGIALHDISSDLADTEAFYTAQINEKIELIEVTSGTLDPVVTSQMELLDEEYKSLKNDLRDHADSEEVINAMIEYYRLKLAMLEKILLEIQKNNDHEEALAI
jgi:hypothetical protein